MMSLLVVMKALKQHSVVFIYYTFSFEFPTFVLVGTEEVQELGYSINFCGAGQCCCDVRRACCIHTLSLLELTLVV